MTRRFWSLVVLAFAVAPAVAGEEARLFDEDEDFVAGEVLVRFRDAAGAEDVLEAAKGLGASHVRSLAGIGVRHWRLGKGVSVEKAVEILERRKDVEWAEPNYVVRAHDLVFPSDPRLGDLWGMHNVGQTGGTADADIDAAEAWGVTTGNASIVVGVIDTGIDYDHPDLAANVWTNPGEVAGNGIDDDQNGYVDDVRGWDFVSNDNDPMDDNGHGSHTAGTVGAVGNNGAGVAGVAWNVRLMPLKFLNSAGNGDTANAVLAVQYAASFRDAGGRPIVRITSSSWGGGNRSRSLESAIAASGALFVASAGNAGTTAKQYPAGYALDNVVAVAATDANDALASFSTYGTWVHLAAPGVDTLSCLRNGGYGLKSGTSMACPHVSGAAALLWAQDGTRTVAAVRSLLLNGVDTRSSLSGKVATGGRLNAYRSLGGTPGSSADATAPATIADLGAGTPEAFQVTLAWTATGDDGATGRAMAYDLRRSTAEITASTWAAATPVTGEPYPATSGTGESFTVTGLQAATAYWFALKAIDEAGNASAMSNVVSVTTATPPTGAWAGELIAATGGYYKGLDFDGNGRPGAAYSVETLDQVRVVLWDAATSTWVDELAGTTGSGAGTDFAFSPAGVPSVSFGWGKLQFAERTSTGWKVTTVEKAKANNDYTSLVYDPAGNPTISYRATTDLRYAKRVGSTWQIQTVDTAGAKFSDLAYDPTTGHPAIAYSDDPDGDGWLSALKVARWNGTAWSVQTLESGTVGYGVYATIAFDSQGNLAVAHAPGGQVRYHRWTGTAWSVEVLSEAANVGQLLFDENDVPRLSLGSSEGTQVASRAIDGTWTYELVDVVTRARTDIAMDPDGNLGVLYGASGNGVKLARKQP